MISDITLAKCVQRAAKSLDVPVDTAAFVYTTFFDIVRDVMRSPTLPEITVPGSGVFRCTAKEVRKRVKTMLVLERKGILSVKERAYLDHYEAVVTRIDHIKEQRRARKFERLNKKYQDGNFEGV